MSAIINGPSLASSQDEAVQPQTSKLLRYRRLWKIQLSFKLADRALLVAKVHQNGQPLFVRERPDRATEVPDLQRNGSLSGLN